MLKLVHPPQRMILTGSRYFGTFQQNSDWDFFTADTKTIRTWLDSRGFKLLPDNPYRDKVTIAVYRHFEPQVDIQIVSSVSRKLKAQESLFPILSRERFTKGTARSLWDLALS